MTDYIKDIEAKVIDLGFSIEAVRWDGAIHRFPRHGKGADKDCWSIGFKSSLKIDGKQLDYPVLVIGANQIIRVAPGSPPACVSALQRCASPMSSIVRVSLLRLPQLGIPPLTSIS